MITLLTDFGWRDPYVGVMKGVIACINPNLRVIDLAHEIPPQDVAAARFCLLSAYPYFPSGTVHVAVVDPGVGSARRAVAIAFSGGFLIGPDNGLLSGVLTQCPATAAVELTNPHYWYTPNPSTTFHGRDIFAPVAAHLASGVDFAALGTAIDPQTLVRLPIVEAQPTPTGWTGGIQYIDRFGNLVTAIPATAVCNRTWYVSVGLRHLPSVQTYGDAPAGELVALVGSHGWVELAVNGGSAAALLAEEIGSAHSVVINLTDSGNTERR
jgi:S-adenosyl-L-methionine hydrolase (adenosine-forming)